uniref:Uncharacterized protein n=1 Tax=Glossina austeni TaxID=7395 RepID=A0A1A9V7N1_GLOAU
MLTSMLILMLILTLLLMLMLMLMLMSTQIITTSVNAQVIVNGRKSSSVRTLYDDDRSRVSSHPYTETLVARQCRLAGWYVSVYDNKTYFLSRILHSSSTNI